MLHEPGSRKFVTTHTQLQLRGSVDLLLEGVGEGTDVSTGTSFIVLIIFEMVRAVHRDGLVFIAVLGPLGGTVGYVLAIALTLGTASSDGLGQGERRRLGLLGGSFQ